MGGVTPLSRMEHGQGGRNEIAKNVTPCLYRPPRLHFSAGEVWGRPLHLLSGDLDHLQSRRKNDFFKRTTPH